MNKTQENIINEYIYLNISIFDDNKYRIKHFLKFKKVLIEIIFKNQLTATELTDIPLTPPQLTIKELTDIPLIATESIPKELTDIPLIATESIPKELIATESILKGSFNLFDWINW